MAPPSPLRHGTVRCYERAKCRCDECTRASREYRADLKDRRRGGRAAQRRYPFGPLLRFLDKSQGEIAVEIGVTRETVGRWKIGGVPEYSADSLAICLGLHPSTIWPDWFEIPLEEPG